MKYCKDIVNDTENNLRDMMRSEKPYDPVEWTYCDGRDHLCGDVDRVAVMDKYQKRCRIAMEKYNRLPSTSSGDKKRKKLLDEIFGQSDLFRRIEAPFRANYGGKHTKLGGMFYAGYNLTLIEDGEIEIGDKTMIGPNVTICTAEHPKDIEIRAKGHGILYNKKVSIGNNVWIGANATILAGAIIGDNCIIGANSIVTKDTVIPPNKVAVGIVTPKNVCDLKDI